MNSVSPVWTAAEVEIERVLALDQPQYSPIIVLPVTFQDGPSGFSVRFRLSDEERARIMTGADIVITELTFGQPFTPISVDVLMPETKPFA